MYTRNSRKKVSTKKLYKELTSGNNELVGISYTSNDFPVGIIPEVYMTDIIFKQGEEFSFTGALFVNDSQIIETTSFNNLLLEAHGLGFIRLEDMQNSIPGGNAMSDFILKGTNLSSTKKVDIVSTFIDPAVLVSSITIGGIIFKL